MTIALIVFGVLQMSCIAVMVNIIQIQVLGFKHEFRDMYLARDLSRKVRKPGQLTRGMNVQEK